MSAEPEFTQLLVSAETRALTSGERITLWVLGIGFTVAMAAGLLEQRAPQQLSVVFFVLFWPLMLVVHELGHALMAAALGWHVGRISIGFGPVLWRGQVGRTAITVRLIPVEGYVLPAPNNTRAARIKSALVYAAGPGAELLILLGLVLAFGLDTVFSDSTAAGPVALKTLAIVIIWGAGFNLLPFAVGGGVSDGLGILLSPFVTSDTIEQRLLVLDELDIERTAASGDVEQALHDLDALMERGIQTDRLRATAVAMLAAGGEHDLARERLDALLDGQPIVELADVNLLHLDAMVHMRKRQRDDLAIDLSLNRALRLAPDNLSLKVTRGIADIQRGRIVEGGNLLADVYRDLRDPFDQVRTLGWLFVAATKIGHDPAAARFGQSFVYLNEHRALAAEIEAAAGRSPVAG